MARRLSKEGKLRKKRTARQVGQSMVVDRETKEEIAEREGVIWN